MGIKAHKIRRNENLQKKNNLLSIANSSLVIDSICESYEDLIQINDTLAHLDIKEQELIHTESVELDTFREDAMDKAKEMLENFINKLKIRYQAFMKWVNKQIINLFK